MLTETMDFKSWTDADWERFRREVNRCGSALQVARSRGYTDRQYSLLAYHFRNWRLRHGYEVPEHGENFRPTKVRRRKTP